jgi:hypothetical protein
MSQKVTNNAWATTIGALTATSTNNQVSLTTGQGARFPSINSTTVTITIASPGVVTWNSHGLVANQSVVFNNTGGALPSGLSAGVTYYVTNPTTNTFQVSATPGGSAITTTGTQSGTQTCSSDWFYATLISSSNVLEIVRVTSISGDSLTVVRGVDNSTISAFAIGSRLELRPTAAAWGEKVNYADAVYTFLTATAAAAAYVPLSGTPTLSGQYTFSAPGVDIPIICRTNQSNNPTMLCFQYNGASVSAYIQSTPSVPFSLLNAAQANVFNVDSSGDIGCANITSTGAITATGNITAYYSDKRLKTKISPIKDAVRKVERLEAFTYRPNSIALAAGFPDQIEVGLSAQDLELVLPQVVKPAPFDHFKDGRSASGENYKTVQYERVVPLLVAAIQELSAQIKTLQAQ